MSLRDSIVADVDNVFGNTNEFATLREFRISDGMGGYTVFDAPCTWDEEASKEVPMVKLHGVYMGDVRCHIGAKHLPRIPIAGELIYSPANTMWEVIDATDEDGMYVLALSAARSKAGTYSNN